MPGSRAARKIRARIPPSTSAMHVRLRVHWPLLRAILNSTTIGDRLTQCAPFVMPG